MSREKSLEHCWNGGDLAWKETEAVKMGRGLKEMNQPSREPVRSWTLLDVCWGLWAPMWAAGASTREAVSLFRDVLSTSGMLGAANPGERGTGLSGRALQLPVAALWNNGKAGLPPIIL